MTDNNSKAHFHTVQEWLGGKVVGAVVKDEAKTAASWSEAIDRGVVQSNELRSLILPPRERLLGDWLCEGDLGLIYAYRGVGKTWFALEMARRLSEGTEMGEWLAHRPTKVLYVDGEMPADLMRQREKGLERGPGEIEF